MAVETRKALGFMRMAKNTERTRIERLERGAQATVTTMRHQPPAEDLYMRDFTRMVAAPPFLVNLCGVATMVGDVVSARTCRDS